MKNNKEFLTYNKQMKHLRNEKNILCNGLKDKEVLCRIGYFNLINGYKNPFVVSAVNGVHSYFTGTSVNDLYNLKKFDDEFRLLLFKYITQIEEEIRTITAYKFDEVNDNGKITWYQLNAYDTTRDIPKVVKTISRVYNEIDRADQDYIRFYLEQHNTIPTWVMVKIIQFYTLINFINSSKLSVKRAISSLYGILDSRGNPDFKLLVGSLHWLRTVRNSCAHNERIFTITDKNSRIYTNYMNSLAPSYSRERDKKIIDLLVYMKYYLPENEYNTLMMNVEALLTDLSSVIHSQAFSRVLAALGVKNINHISLLRLATKQTPINYCIFEKM
ncbi:MAG: Abi family protein [Oscillospiraceae bacterium]|nr:Abi family protein [Oscillospiraceae bacterium]